MSISKNPTEGYHQHFYVENKSAMMVQIRGGTVEQALFWERTGGPGHFKEHVVAKEGRQSHDRPVKK